MAKRYFIAAVVEADDIDGALGYFAARLRQIHHPDIAHPNILEMGIHGLRIDLKGGAIVRSKIAKQLREIERAFS